MGGNFEMKVMPGDVLYCSALSVAFFRGERQELKLEKC